MTKAYWPFAIHVVSSGGGGGTQPGPNQVVLVGGSSTMDSLLSNPRLTGPLVQPQAFSSHDFNYALHGAYGAGTYVPGVGTNGAYVAVNGGGDGAPNVWDAAVFYFDTETWGLVVNAQGVPNYAYKQFVNITDGPPYYEVTGYSQVPPCDQHYHVLVGYNGKVIKTVLAYGPSIVSSPYSHSFDVATGQYARFADNANPAFSMDSQAQKEGYALLDTTRINSTSDRIWYCSLEEGYINRLPYMDLGVNPPHWNTSVSFTPTLPYTNATQGYPTYAFLTDGTHKGILLFNISGGQMYGPRVLDLTSDATTALGFRAINVTGTPTQYLAAFDRSLSSGPAHDQNLDVKWDQFPGDGCLYTYDGFSGKITKIAPPAYANWYTANWVVSTITPTGAALPQQYDSTNLPHYSRFFYIPPKNCFAWVAGGPNQVALWKPF